MHFATQYSNCRKNALLSSFLLGLRQMAAQKQTHNSGRKEMKNTQSTE